MIWTTHARQQRFFMTSEIRIFHTHIMFLILISFTILIPGIRIHCIWTLTCNFIYMPFICYILVLMHNGQHFTMFYCVRLSKVLNQHSTPKLRTWRSLKPISCSVFSSNSVVSSCPCVIILMGPSVRRDPKTGVLPAGAELLFSLEHFACSVSHHLATSARKSATYSLLTSSSVPFSAMPAGWITTRNGTHPRSPIINCTWLPTPCPSSAHLRKWYAYL